MFSKSRTASNGASLVAASRGVGGSFSVIGADVVITGNVIASADLHIDGRIDGDIACASLVQGEASHIAGGVVAESARLAGTVEGSIDAKELVIARSARISGDIGYERITIEAGAQVDGRFTQRAGTRAVAESEPPLTLVAAE